MSVALMRTVLVMLVLTSVPGLAAEPAPDVRAGLSDTEIDQRIAWLERRLEDSRTHGQIWYWSWMTINGGSMVGNGIVATMSGQHDDRVNYWTGAALGAIGVADLLLRPLDARYGAAPNRALPEATRAEKLAKLRAAEDLLRRNALRADERHQIMPHLGNAGLAIAAGLVVGLWGERGSGIQTGVSTLVGGTLNLLTQPARPEQDWNDYLSMTGRRSVQLDVSLMLATFEDGGRFDLRFRW